jgi:hypothetical protein
MIDDMFGGVPGEERDRILVENATRYFHMG